MKIRIIHFIAGAFILYAPLSQAAVDISGYASFKAIANVNDNGASYYNALVGSSFANYDSRESNLGVQFSTDLSSKMDMTVVLSARGAKQKYNIETEWAYANYKVNDDLSVRIGKVKGPFYMVSDYKDVGYAYPWVSPPEEVYSTNPIRSVNGIDLVYQATVDDVTYLGELYYGGGTNTANPISSVAAMMGMSVDDVIEFETYQMLGFNASVNYEGISFRAGYFRTLVNVPAFGITGEMGSFGGVGMTIDMNNIVVYSEYIVRDTGPNLVMAFPDAKAFYVTAGYRMGDFLPYVTMAKLDEDKDFSPAAMKQDSMAYGLRVEIDDVTDVKFEVATKTPAAGNYGLYDSPITGSGTLYTIALDTLF